MDLQFSKLLAVHFKSMLLHQLRILKPTSIKFLLWVSVLFPWWRKWLSIYYSCNAQPLSFCTYFPEHCLYRDDEVVPWPSTNPLYPIMWGKSKHPSNPVLNSKICTSTSHPDVSLIQAFVCRNNAIHVLIIGLKWGLKDRKNEKPVKQSCHLSNASLDKNK